MSFAAIDQVDAYWEGMRNGRLMPERAEVSPRGLESALEFAFILEHVAPGVARFRLAGGHLSDLLGMEVRAMPVTSLIEPPARARFARVLDKVITTPQVADIRLSSPAAVGRPALVARLYLAPLATGGPDRPRILGCLQSLGQIGRAPRRFGIDQVHLRRIVASAGCGAPQETPQPRWNEIAEPAAIFQPAPEMHHSRQHLAGHGKPQLRLIGNED